MMEINQWSNKKGYTLNLTREEIDELYQLLKGCSTSFFISQESEHFVIELDDYKDDVP